MLFLNSKNILSFVDYSNIVNSVERALILYKEKKYAMPDRFNYTYKNKTLLYMPCFTDEIFGTKILSVFPENSKLNHPVIDGLMLLNDYATGSPIALLDGKIITSLRTGAVGGIGLKYLSNDLTENLGLIGTGTQGFYQLLYACSLRNIKNVYLYNRTTSTLNSFMEKISKHLPNINFIPCKNSDEVVKNSETIIFATSSFEPVIPNNESLYKGKTFIAIGSFKPNMRELSDGLVSACDEIYIDTEFAKEESGDLHIPLSSGIIQESKIHLLSSIIGMKNTKNDGTKTLLYKSVGMALFDVVVGEEIYKGALANKIGIELDL